MASVRVALLNTKDVSGGAARATHRIYSSLQDTDIEAKLFVQRKDTDDPNVVGPEGKGYKLLAKARPYLERLILSPYRSRANRRFTPALTYDTVAARVDEFDPDVVHLNWVGYGFLNLETLLSFDAPLVWRMPDMWLMTGGCHYAYDCDRFENRCGSCPQLGSSHDWDLSRLTWRRKARVFDRLNLTVVAPSTWLAEQARASSLLGDCDVRIIPNALDTELYRPVDPTVGRELFGLDGDRQTVLFGAIEATSDSRKGFDELRAAISEVAERYESPGDVELVVFGADEPVDGPDFELDVTYVGYLNDEPSLAALYAAADVMVVPSLYEGFGQTVSESLACGTPVVAFDATGPSDTVDHRENGYLAEPYDPEDLARGITYVLEDPARADKLGRNAREKALRVYRSETVCRQYRSLYKDVVAGRATE